MNREKLEKGKRFDNALDEIARPFLIHFVTYFLKAVFLLYDIVSFIPFKIFADPVEKLRVSNRTKARPTVPGDPASPWRSLRSLESNQTDLRIESSCTLGKVWDELAKKYGPNRCVGAREVLSVTKERQEDGRFFEKMELGDYNWLSYTEVDDKINALAKGLLEEGHLREEKVLIMAETSKEWMITALACFKGNYPIVTVYATLGESAVTYAIKQCNATTIFTSSTNFNKVTKAVKDCPFVKRIIYYSPIDPEARIIIPDELRQADLNIYTFDELINIGNNSDQNLAHISNADDLALIMYTSGTTGIPKGVMISHRNLIAATSSQAVVAEIRSNDVYIGYLPLAHILEICAEMICLSKGCSIGYSSPHTLFDKAAKIKKGQLGDCSALRPTLVAFVPAVLDRIFKSIADEVSQASSLMREVFRVCYERKRSRYEEGYTSSLLNRLAFNKTRSILGGRIRLMISGGAPLNPETQRFINICFCCPVMQGYGLTETCGCATISDYRDLSTGTVGPPLDCCEIMLREWKEGGYSPYNKRPQGEVLISGDHIALGYHKNPEKTAEDFIMIDRKRWFATGDIGEFREDGSLCIIDRKKDLVKLAHAEYVSLSKVETTVLMNPFVDNVCVIADSDKDYVGALIVPNLKHVKSIASKLGLTSTDQHELCNNEKLVKSFTQEIQSFCKDKLLRVEIPKKIHLCNEAWTPASGLLTDALKLRRKEIEKKFCKEINALWL